MTLSRLAPALGLLALVGCGLDDEPVRPGVGGIGSAESPMRSVASQMGSTNTRAGGVARFGGATGEGGGKPEIVRDLDSGADWGGAMRPIEAGGGGR